MVRARDKDSLENMVAAIELAGQAGAEVDALTENDIYSESNSDYAWRIVVSKETFALWTQFEVLNFITYPNFKNETSKYKNAKFMSALHGVWSQMLKVDESTTGTYSYNPTYVPQRGSVGSTFFDPYDDGLDDYYGPSDSELRQIEGLEDYPDFGSTKEGQFDYLNGYWETLPGGHIKWNAYDPEEILDGEEGTAAVLESEDTDGNVFSIMNDAGEWVTIKEHASAQGKGSEDIDL